MEILANYVRSNVLIALFLSIAIGYAIGKIRFGKFQLGGIAGSLLVSVVVGQLGFNIPGVLKTAFFALFIYACGYNGGPKFFGSLNRSSLKFVLSAIFMTVSGLICVLIGAKLFHLDRGLAAGLAAGGLTQSSIIGTAGSAITNLGLDASLTKQLQTNVAVGYSITYIIGSLGPILMVGTFIPLIMKWNLRKEALKLEAEENKGIVLSSVQTLALEKVSSRIFQVGKDCKYIGKTALDFEVDLDEKVFLLQVSRNNTLLQCEDLDKYIFTEGDWVVIGGKTKVLLPLSDIIGEEKFDKDSILNTIEYKKSIIFNNKSLSGKTISEIKKLLPARTTVGFVISQIWRNGEELPLTDDFKFTQGDEVMLMGREENIDDGIQHLGYLTPKTNVVSYITFSVGMIIGILLGAITIHFGSMPISLGTGGGCLLSGLIFGWLRSKKPKIGGLDQGTANFLQVFGLVVFVSIVGLNAGKGAITTIKQYGMTLFWLGVFVTIVPQVVTFVFNYFVLKIKNPVKAVAIIAGGRSANPALSEILAKTENSTPVLPFTIGYAVANILLTMWGPVIVGIITQN